MDCFDNEVTDPEMKKGRTIIGLAMKVYNVGFVGGMMKK